MLTAIKKACKGVKVSKMASNEWLVRMPEKEHNTHFWVANVFTLKRLEDGSFSVKYQIWRECRRNGKPSANAKSKTVTFASFDQAIEFINE